MIPIFQLPRMPGCSFLEPQSIIFQKCSVVNTFCEVYLQNTWNKNTSWVRNISYKHYIHEIAGSPRRPDRWTPGFHLLRRPMSVLVIGAAGAVGKRLIGALAARGGGTQKLRGGPWWRLVEEDARGTHEILWILDPWLLRMILCMKQNCSAMTIVLRFCSALNAKCYHRLTWYCFVHFLGWECLRAGERIIAVDKAPELPDSIRNLVMHATWWKGGASQGWCLM